MCTNTDFDVRRFIGRGCYSIVYEVQKTSGQDALSLYALKRFFLEDDSSVKCVLRERHILERLALAEFQSPFLPVLFYSLWHNFSAAFVLREGVGCDLYDLLCHVGFLSEIEARFYLTEVICGLEHLHSMDIVHLDVKPENILFYHDGHVFVSDLDRSFDIALNKDKKPTLDDFTGTPLFMAPEIAKGECIDPRADTWSLGALVAEMVAGSIRSDQLTTAQEFQGARMGTYNIRRVKRFSKPLQSFFTACLQKNYTQRPHLAEVKKLRFLKSVDWSKVNSRLSTPPYKTADIQHRPTKDESGPLKSTDQRMLDSAFSPQRPLPFVRSHGKKDKKDKTVQPVENVQLTQRCSQPLSDQLRHGGYTLDSLNKLFQSFPFIHPNLRCADDLLTLAEDKLSNSNDLETLFGDLTMIEPDAPTAPSLFRRSRKRGLSIGD